MQEVSPARRECQELQPARDAFLANEGSYKGGFVIFLQQISHST